MPSIEDAFGRHASRHIVIEIIGGAVLALLGFARMVSAGKSLLKTDPTARPLPPASFVDTRHRL